VVVKNSKYWGIAGKRQKTWPGAGRYHYPLLRSARHDETGPIHLLRPLLLLAGAAPAADDRRNSSRARSRWNSCGRIESLDRELARSRGRGATSCWPQVGSVETRRRSAAGLKAQRGKPTSRPHCCASTRAERAAVERSSRRRRRCLRRQVRAVT